MAEILIISENADERKLLELVLEQAGHHCISAATIAQALSYLQSMSIDLLIFPEIFFAHSNENELRKIEVEMQKIGVLMLSINGCIYWGDQEPAFYDFIDNATSSPPEIKDLLNVVRPRNWTVS
jgi:DNA-binding NtrC family response regulator